MHSHFSVNVNWSVKHTIRSKSESPLAKKRNFFALQLKLVFLRIQYQIIISKALIFCHDDAVSHCFQFLSGETPVIFFSNHILYIQYSVYFSHVHRITCEIYCKKCRFGVVGISKIRYNIAKDIIPRACLKNHSRNLYSPLCGKCYGSLRDQ